MKLERLFNLLIMSDLCSKLSFKDIVHRGFSLLLSQIRIFFAKNFPFDE